MKTPRKIVEAIIADLNDRRGLRHEWDAIDEDIREVIAEKWTRIVSDGMSGPVAVSTMGPPRDPVTDEPLVALTVYVEKRSIDLINAEASR